MKDKIYIILFAILISSESFATTVFDFTTMNLSPSDISLMNGSISYNSTKGYYEVSNNVNDTLSMTINGVPNVVFIYWAETSKIAFKAKPNEYLQIDGANRTIKISNLNINDIVTLRVASKGPSAANSFSGGLTNCTLYGGNLTQAGYSYPFVYEDVAFQATASTIEITNSAGGYCLSNIFIGDEPPANPLFPPTQPIYYDFTNTVIDTSDLVITNGSITPAGYFGQQYGISNDANDTMSFSIAGLPNVEFCYWNETSSTAYRIIPSGGSLLVDSVGCTIRVSNLKINDIIVIGNSCQKRTPRSFSGGLTNCKLYSGNITGLANGYDEVAFQATGPTIEITNTAGKYQLNDITIMAGLPSDYIYLYYPNLNYPNNRFKIWYVNREGNGDYSPLMAPVPNHNGWYQTSVPSNSRLLTFVCEDSQGTSTTQIYPDDDYDGVNACYVYGQGWQYDFSGNKKKGGKCGDYLKWVFEDGVFSVFGTGEMYDYKTYLYDVVSTLVKDLRDSIISVSIGENVTSIGKYAFFDCDSLTSVTIGNSVNRIDTGAFAGCDRLKEIIIPNSVRIIGDRAFACSSLESIIVDSTNSHLDSRNNCNAIIETSTNKLIQGCYTTIIPDDVISIGDGAFCDCVNLTAVTLPNYVTSIGDGAFSGCVSLTSIAIPNSVTRIGEDAFSSCSGLTSVMIGNGVTQIGKCAFLYCSGLTSVEIGKNVTQIGFGAFSFCYGLDDLTCKAAIPPLCEQYVFEEVNKSIPLYVPTNSVNAYKTAYVWKEFTNIVGVEDGIETINANISGLRKTIINGKMYILLPDSQVFDSTGKKVE